MTIQETLEKAIEYHKANQLHEADKLYTAILVKVPGHPDANHNLGVLAMQVNKPEVALPLFEKALQTNPESLQYKQSLVNAKAKLNDLPIVKAQHFDDKLTTLFNKKKYDKALKMAKEVVQKNPNHALGWKIIGMIEYMLKDYDNALTHLKKSLALNTNDPQIYFNLGNVLDKFGKIEDAIVNYQLAIQHKPDIAEAHYNISVLLQKSGKLSNAMAYCKNAIRIKVDYAEAYHMMGSLLKEIQFTKFDPEFEQLIIQLLEKNSYSKPKDIFPSAISLIKTNPQYLSVVHSNDSVFNNTSNLHRIYELQKLPLLLKLMKVTPIPNLEIEKLLTTCRSWCLLNIDELTISKDITRFLSSLALQCFTNEYIYKMKEEEVVALEKLEQSIVNNLFKGNSPHPISILVLASYIPLYSFSWIGKYAFPAELSELETRQVKEPKEEKELCKTIPNLQKITNNISSKVREQYEANPYPRWVNLEIAKFPISIPDLIQQFRLQTSFKGLVSIDKPDILIAGCGTGQHSIGTASRFKNSKVLAVDLSLSSLSYAKRKTNELKIDSIEYMQADILDLGNLGKTFDIVESSGVLHHMDDPISGWKVLVDCLRPGGLMKIGLYSDFARQHIVQIRTEIENRNLTETHIKDFRSELILSDKEHHKLIHNSPDFYSLSEVRDLLFHVQEHRFTIPKIIDALKQFKLKFCGFEDANLISQFKFQFSEPESLYDLNKWEIFEKENQRAFAGMYQFWCQKQL